MTMTTILCWSHYTMMLCPPRGGTRLGRSTVDTVVVLIVMMIIISTAAAAVGVVVIVSR